MAHTCWKPLNALSAEVVFNKDPSTRLFLNLKLSYQGSERQPPSILTLALVFSAVMEEKNKEGSGQGTTEQRLRLAVEEFHSQPGMVNRWKLDEDRFKACLNLMVGTSSAARFQIQSHLNYHKWAVSAFTSELLKSSRWLIGASPRWAKEAMKPLLTVTPDVQCWFLQNYISWFSTQAKKSKASSRAKNRFTLDQWDRFMDYTCVMAALKKEAVKVLDGNPKQDAVVESIEAAFMGRPVTHAKKNRAICLPNWNIKHLSAWSELVHPEMMLADITTPADVEAVEEATAQAMIVEKFMGKICSVNLVGDVLIEDKCASLGLALRDLRITLDPKDLHGNSERPAHFQAWLAVAETALPLKGTWHRRTSHDDVTKPVNVCSMTNSDLWKLQGFSSENIPKAIPESAFTVPSQRAFFTGNDCRRNLTDQQETAQWITGEDLFVRLLESLLGILSESAFRSRTIG
eukprot:s95_g31.t1